MKRLKNKTVLITGAGRGIGRALALAMAGEGADLMVNDLGGDEWGHGADQSPADQVAAEIRAAGGSAVANHDDVADFAAAAEMVRGAIDAFGRLDVIISVAAVHQHDMLETHESAAWDRVMAVNVKGPFNLAHHAIPVMRKQNWGAIINFISGAAWEPPERNAAYSVSKAALLTLTLSEHNELSRHNISANGISPGVTRTRLAEKWLDRLGPEEKRKWGTQEPANLAPLAIYLSSDEGHSISGHIFEVRDDQIILVAPPARSHRILRNGDHWTVEGLASALPPMVGM